MIVSPFGTPVPPFSTSNPVNPASLTGYHLENSGGRFSWVRAGQGVVGPVSMGSFPVALGSNPQQRAANVLTLISQSNLIQLTSQDLNNDGTVAFDELCVLIVENWDVANAPLQPANRPNNPIQVSEFGGTVTKTIAVNVAFVGPRTPFYQIAHECSHSLGLGATSDLRGYGDSKQPERHSVMSGYSFDSERTNAPFTFDGFQARLGWTDARIYSLTTPQEVDIPVSHSARPDAPVLLWDSQRGSTNYFLLEYPNA